MSVKCTKCNSDNSDTARFCSNCASPISIESVRKMDPSDRPDISNTKTMESSREKFAAGSTFAGRYQVIEKLGKGGMGKVYKVKDQNIDEVMALKIIKPEISDDVKTINRFKDELKLARKIGHQNVCRLYDLHEEGSIPFITMEYVSGIDLKSYIRREKVLAETKVIGLGKQICAGLAEAHRLGVIHRDLKPQNIMIDNAENLKIMDFGIARSVETKGMTQTGMILGSPEYMSPEQVEGEETDQRSDIYSVGIMLYELVTGSVPFKGDSAFILAMKHKTEKPSDPRDINDKISEDLSCVIQTCLEKDKENRYQEAEELLSELIDIEKGLPITERIPSKKKPKPEVQSEFTWKNSIAVLPFSDLSPLKDQEYFCDGMTEDIITRLCRVGELKVISRTSAMRYKTTDNDIKVIGKELGVATILEGSIRKEKENIRVSAQLINVKDDFHLWADTYDRRLESIFEVQDEVSKAIAEALKVKFTPKTLKALKSERPKNVEAYEYYLKGMHFINSKYVISHREDDFNAAVDMIKRAIEIEPNYALAFMGLGWSYQHHYQITGIRKDLDKVIKNGEMSYKLDPNLAEANAIKAWVSFLKNEYESTYRSYKRALALDPNNSIISHVIGLFFRNLGLLHLAVKHSSKSIELDPFYLLSHSLRARCLIYLGEVEKAALNIEKALEIEPDNFWSLVDCCLLNISKKKYEKGWELLTRAEKFNPEYSSVKFYKALLLAVNGEKHKALSINKNGVVYALLGMKKEALKYISKNIKGGKEHFQYSYLPLINSHFYDNLRDDTQFHQIVKIQKQKYEERLKKYGDL